MEKRSGKTFLKWLPGIVLCFIVMMLGIFFSSLLGAGIVKLKILPEGSASPVSSIFVSILIGLFIRNTIGLHDKFKKGVSFSIKYVLRIGIVLLGLRLSLLEAIKLGAWGIPLIVVCIFSGLAITLYFTKKMRQSNRLGTLTACGTGICGVTAIMAAAPVIKAKDNEISYAVANITMFGLVGMLLYPYLAHFFFSADPIKAGLFIGTAIHDTAQVTGAALMYNQIYGVEKVVEVATVTKLTRNLFIIVIIPFVSYLFFKGEPQTGKTGSLPKWYTFIPLFVVGFLMLAFIRTLGDMTAVHSGLAFGFAAPSEWEGFHHFLSSFGSTYLLGMAMAGVGLSTDFKMFKGFGMKPFLIGFIAAISVGALSFTLVYLFGHYITL